MTESPHLTEEQRHGVADGSLDRDTLRASNEHLSECHECAADVHHLRMLMERTRTVASPFDATTLNELWPDIHARIDQSKVVALGSSAAVSNRPARRLTTVWIASVAAAAIILMLLIPRMRLSRIGGSDSTWATTQSGPELINAADSMRAYAAEANELLNQLELQRAMMPPATRVSIDHDLQVIDDAIRETRDALARDPNNPALLRLLASSYRQKVDLLKRANGAG